MSESINNKFRILSLDGGGAKGVYTLGVLEEVERACGHYLYKEFELIYGTSTGAIIAALLGLGLSVSDVKAHYFQIVPDVMRFKRAKNRSAALRLHAERVFGSTKFDSFKTDVGIVTTEYDLARPMIFKSSKAQAHGMAASFEPGFGCTIADALRASSAAYPFFEKVTLKTTNQGQPTLIDGGFIANNPTLLAIADAVKAYQIPKERIKVLSVGTGIYNEPRPSLGHRILFSLQYAKLAIKVIQANTNTVEQLRSILFRDVETIRINDAFPQAEYMTDLLESDPDKLQKLNRLGRESFSKFERELRVMFGWA